MICTCSGVSAAGGRRMTTTSRAAAQLWRRGKATKRVCDTTERIHCRRYYIVSYRVNGQDKAKQNEKEKKKAGLSLK